MSELFRIIIFVSQRHPRGSKLKLSFPRRIQPGRTPPLHPGSSADLALLLALALSLPCLFLSLPCLSHSRELRFLGIVAPSITLHSFSSVYRLYLACLISRSLFLARSAYLARLLLCRLSTDGLIVYLSLSVIEK